MPEAQIPLLELDEASPLVDGDGSGNGHHLRFPKPGNKGARRALLVPDFLGKQEVEEIHSEARRLTNALPTGKEWLEVVECAEYRHPSMEALLKPVQCRLLKLLTQQHQLELVISSASIRLRSLRSAGVKAECVPDHDYYCTAVLGLGTVELVVQPASTRRSQRRRLLAQGDLFVHHFDLPVLLDGCYLVIKFKDSLLSCLTNTAPWHMQLAKEGDADAQLALAIQLEQRNANMTEVFRWLRASAEQGHADAQACLGERCEDGEALRWMHEAALQGQHRAQRRLAEQLHLQGNVADAQKWLRRAADEDDLEAVEQLVVCLVRDNEISEALRWCRHGAELGSASLQHRWAMHLLVGENCTKNEASALVWLRRAAEQGHAAAQNNLGVVLAAGLCGPAEPEEGQRHFRAAALQGDAFAKANLTPKTENRRVEMSAEHRTTLEELIREVNDLATEAQSEKAKLQAKQLAEILQKLESASQPVPKNGNATPSRGTAPSKAVSSRPTTAPHFCVSEAGNGLETQEPFVLKDAMTRLSGQKVLDFMPRLMTACGRDVVNYEVQGRGKAQSLAAPFAQYIQLLQRSESGEAYFMMSDKLLRPELSDLLSIPEGLTTGEEFHLPTLALSGKRWIQVGGKGAKTRLKKDPVVAGTWNMLVLGRARWVLLPPGSDVTSQGQSCWGDEMSEEDGSRCLEVWNLTQEMGEVVVVPPGWWHQVMLEDRVLSISAQFLATQHVPLVYKQLQLLGAEGNVTEWLSKKAPEDLATAERTSSMWTAMPSQNGEICCALLALQNWSENLAHAACRL